MNVDIQNSKDYIQNVNKYLTPEHKSDINVVTKLKER